MTMTSGVQVSVDLLYICNIKVKHQNIGLAIIYCSLQLFSFIYLG